MFLLRNFTVWFWDVELQTKLTVVVVVVVVVVVAFTNPSCVLPLS